MLHRAIPQKIVGMMNLCTSTHQCLESEDPALIEEHELLLSKFMKPSSRGTKNLERVSSNNFETVFRSQASLHGASNSIYDDFSAVTDPGVSSRGRKNCDSKVALGLPLARRSTSNLLSTDERSSPSSVERDSSSPAPSSTRSPAPRTRRSARSRTKQVNYYPVISLSLSDSEEGPAGGRNIKPLNTGSRGRNQRNHNPNQSCQRVRHLDSNTSPVSHAEKRIIYSSRGVQIYQLNFRSLDDFKDLIHAPFSPERNAVKYARRYRESMTTSSEILHVDFDPHEMTAMLNILSLHGWQHSPISEVSISDQVIEVLSSHDVNRDFAKEIPLLRELARLISNDEVVDTCAWLWEVLTSEVRSKNQQRVKRCLIQLLTFKGMAGDGILSASPAVIKRQLQILLSCLPHASILYRRQPADIYLFIQTAKKGRLSSSPSIIQAARESDSSSSSVFGSIRTLNNVNTLLQNRELGGSVKRQLRTKVKTDFSLLKTWKGASNDVNVLAWSPDGTRFAAGATAHCDERNMEYNRGNNLVIGDLTCNRLDEVPGHHIFRPPGRVASQRATSDNRLFMSVTAMQWFDDTLVTASYDSTVKLWRVSGNRTTNYKTLPHESKVLVMARSNFDENLLATGAQSFRLWNIRESRNAPLIIESRRDLTPTCLAWGSTHDTKNLLLAGMSERDDGIQDNCPAPNGFLTGWLVGEASITPTPFQPNSQNIFDIKWHPTLPRFATASTVGQSQVSRGTRSVVRVFEPLKWRSQTIEFECPALDINDITFCPMNPYYVTASCTNGVTYVWDYRKRDQVLLELPHGEPLNQLDELLEREQDDVGVRMALWGDEINQFYTGASDGIVKQWNILRSQEDALTKNVFGIEEEIMCGAFSSDKSNLLIGDAGGGIHILSTSTSSPQEGRDPNEDGRKMEFRRAPQPPCDDYASDSESGLVAARKLLKSGKLTKHPIFGVGQGPHYDGPFARWARPGNPDQPHLASLEPDIKMRQLDGPAPKDRIGLDKESRQLVEAHIQLARIRNQRRNEYKRKRVVAVIDLCSDEEDEQGLERRAPSEHVYIGNFMGIANLQCEVIDLTGDTDTDLEENAGTSRVRSHCSEFPEMGSLLEKLEAGLEEDYWWPDSGQVNPNFPGQDQGRSPPS